MSLAGWNTVALVSYLASPMASQGLQFVRERTGSRPHLIYRSLCRVLQAEMSHFSRDGRDMVYVSFPDGTLWRAKRDGSDEVQLIEPSVYPRNPQ